MPRRQIGQERLALDSQQARGGSFLDEAAALVDWAELERLLANISASAEGEPGWPPVALFRALLLATWHDLSDVRLAEALDDRVSFRRFCGFAASERTAEAEAKRKRLYDAIEAGVADHVDPMLKDRIGELTTVRDHARADVERAEASIERLGATVTPSMLTTFAAPRPAGGCAPSRPPEAGNRRRSAFAVLYRNGVP